MPKEGVTISLDITVIANVYIVSEAEGRKVAGEMSDRPIFQLTLFVFSAVGE